MPSNSKDSFSFRARRKLGKLLAGEDAWINKHGSFRERELHGLITRAHYAYGMLRAADIAKHFSQSKTNICEFGVASGAGLLNMVKLAELISNETGVEFIITGFDTGAGLPDVQGHKDHAELWNPGDFVMEDPALLKERIAGKANLIIGDIKDTIDGFRETLSPEAPLGFVSIDVDIYSGTKSAFRVFDGPADHYSPAVSIYFDDISFYFANSWCGELLAIREFNAAQESRKIDQDRSLPGRRTQLVERWHRMMYACHILDHEARNIPMKRESKTISAHHDFMVTNSLY